MVRYRILMMVSAMCVGGLWTTACGDGTGPEPEPPRPARVTVSPASATLKTAGATAQFSAKVVDQHGVEMANATVTWASSDPTVATVSASGLAMAVGDGAVTITAAAGDVQGTADVSVLVGLESLALVALYEATGGRSWTHNDGWISGLPLGEWYGVETDDAGHVVGLDLGLVWNPDQGSYESMGLTGSIPPEIGNLVHLTRLSLDNNSLSGGVPPEIADLSRLTYLSLASNNLSGTIGPVIGNLTGLRRLYLDYNDFSGPIPPEIGHFAGLQVLDLGYNELSGPIPPELGNNADLIRLRLQHNALSGPVPPEIGNLSALEQLYLASNDLTGPVPPELAGITGLRAMDFADNSEMEGPLPMGLTGLAELQALMAGGTDLCAPMDPGFRTWLEQVDKRRIRPCMEAPPAAYLVQAVQSRHFPVPLVAGDSALLRVFVTAAKATSEGIPEVRARFYLDGAEAHAVSIPGKSTPIPTEVDEGSLDRSANAVIAGQVVQPGLEMVIDIDPEGTLDPELGVAKRIPETGRLAVNVRAMPVLDLTVIRSSGPRPRIRRSWT